MTADPTMEELKLEFEELKKVPYVTLSGADKKRYGYLKNALKNNGDRITPENLGNLDKEEGPVDEAPVEPAESPKPAEKPKSESPQDRIERTRQFLENGPKMTIAVPLAQDEKPGAKDSVTINGYRKEFTKGIQVELPTPMAELVLAHYGIGINRGLADEYRISGTSQGKNLGDISTS